jgi:molecular chaperone GrpE
MDIKKKAEESIKVPAESIQNTVKKTTKKSRKSSKTDKSTKKIVELEEALEESKDKHLRLYAEFENYKKRTVKERIELMKNAAQDTLSSLLPVLDDFDRAKKSADDKDSDEQFSEGVTLVYNKLKNTLQSKGLKVMETNGEPFNPEFHEAITEIPSPSEDMKGKIIDTIESGYLLNDKIIRYAKVVVGK